MQKAPGNDPQLFDIFLLAVGRRGEIRRPASQLCWKRCLSCAQEPFPPAVSTMQTYDALQQKFLEHHAPVRLMIAERAKFHGREQREGDSLAELAVAIKGPAITCKVDTFFHQVLRDRLIAGYRKTEIEKALLELDEDKFDLCCRVATAKDLATDKSEELGVSEHFCA